MGRLLEQCHGNGIQPGHSYIVHHPKREKIMMPRWCFFLLTNMNIIYLFENCVIIQYIFYIGKLIGKKTIPFSLFHFNLTASTQMIIHLLTLSVIPTPRPNRRLYSLCSIHLAICPFCQFHKDCLLGLCLADPYSHGSIHKPRSRANTIDGHRRRPSNACTR